MIIDIEYGEYAVIAEESIRNALLKISSNKSKIIFVITDTGLLVGSATDGDFRRWLFKQETINLERQVREIVNPNPVVANIKDSKEHIASLLSHRIAYVPLLDSKGRMVAIAKRRYREIQIENKTISEESQVFIIAEIGNNHNGDLSLAKKLVDEAVASGADCAKFQMRNMQALYKNINVDDSTADLGTQYTLDLLKKYQLSNDELFCIFDYCREKGIIPLCTPWDIESAESLDKYGISAFKIASADFTNHDLISAISDFHKPLLCSTGMSTEQEIVEGIELLKNSAVQFALLHCNSTYPAPFKDVNLKYIEKLKSLGDCIVGYSGHERGVAIAIAAVAHGAKIIEKHFTLDKSMEGNDHKISLLPSEFAIMVEGIRQVEQAEGNDKLRKLSQGEIINRENLAKSIIAKVNIPKGSQIKDDMLEVSSPGQGLQPMYRNLLLGKTINRDMQAGEVFHYSDISDYRIKPRDYTFNRPWGIPVRYHDLYDLINQTNCNLVEIHLSYKDLELEYSKYINQPLKLDLIVHAPELFSNDIIIDLCSKDDAYREKSIENIQNVINLVRRLKTQFKLASRPLIIVNVGGFSKSGWLNESEISHSYSRLAESLRILDAEGVEIIPQTMPPFPWHFGGQQYHNIFVKPEDIKEFCEKNAMRVCIDISHSKLACNYFKWSFMEYMEMLAPYAAHLHIADASGVDGEGLQINDGDIDWPMLTNLLNKKMPNVSFIPEIWQGHKNKGEGFWVALEKLENLFKS